MTRLLAVAVLFAVATLTPADEKKVTPAITDIANDKADKIETEKGKATEPITVSTEKELEKAIPDEVTRKRIAKLVDFKEQKLLVFAWQGSGQDKLSYVVAESYPEQLMFTYTVGKTDDLRRHVKLYVIRNNVRLSVK
jgi:hypothetical protein